MKTKLPKLLILAQFVLLTLGSASTPLWAAAVSQNEFWVSAVPTGTTHDGTMADPYDGSTQVKFDDVMQNIIPANCTIHLLGGTYMTKGNWNGFDLVNTVKTGHKILGSGMDITTIVLSNPATSGIFGNGAPNGTGWGTGIEISDLTCDANAQNLTADATYAAIGIQGTSTKIRRVKVKGLAHGTVPATSEVFGIVACTVDGVNADDVVIEDCVVMPPVRGVFCSSIAIWAGTGSYITARISGNWVYGTNTTTVQSFNIICSYNTTLSGNHVVNADSGIYADNGGNTNLTVVNNSFQNVGVGVALLGNFTHQNLYFSGNTFELAYDPNQGSYAFSQYGGAYLNEKIIGNTIKAYGTVGPSFFAVAVASTTNLVVADNSIDNQFKWYFPGCTNVILHDNVDLLGNFLSATNEFREFPNSLTRTTVSSSPYTAQYLDRYIGVQIAGTVRINLPSPVGHEGKEYIIANERSSGTVNIFATAPAKINGSAAGGSVQFTAGFGSRTVTTDGINWFAR